MAGAQNDTCLACDQALPGDGVFVTCIECNFSYHLGDCSGVQGPTSRSKGDSLRKNWRCPTCLSAIMRSASKETTPDVPGMLVSINDKLESLLGLKETVDSIDQSIQLMSKDYQELLEEVRKHGREINDLKKRVEGLENTDHTKEMQALKSDLHDLEWRSRRLNLEIHNVPPTENENLMTKVNEVALKLDLPALEASDVVALHRLPSKPDKVPGIIIRFAQQEKRDEWLWNKRKLPRGQRSIYILENLTKQNKALLPITKEWAKQRSYQFVWHKNGKILVRRKEGERAAVVRCEDDLRKLQ